MSAISENGNIQKKVSNARRILPQVLASTAVTILVLNIGATITFPTILISSLLFAKTGISLDETQASWIGSLSFICQPIGSLLSGTVVELLGRKKGIMVVNIPHIIGWTLVWLSEDLVTLFVANALLGFGIGLMESTIAPYIGEIGEPSLRGTLVLYVNLALTIGQFGVFLLGTVLSWRTTAAICLAIPLINILAAIFIPESPTWLLAKGRDNDALRSLQWLRGWTDKEGVNDEYEEMKKHNEYSQRCQVCDHPTMKTISCPHQNMSKWKKYLESLTLLFKKETMRPLLLITMFFGFTNLTSIISVKPTFIELLKVYRMPLDEHWITVTIGIVGIIVAVISMILMRYTGKRPLVLICMVGSLLVTYLLGAYAYYNIPFDVSSFRDNVITNEETSWIPLVLFTLLYIFNGLAIQPTPWILMSEVFPYRTRAQACGITAAICYVWIFIATKTYINVESTMHIYGAFYLYATITLIGFVYLYFYLPETEHIATHDVEKYFSGEKSVIFANDIFFRRIMKLMGKSTENMSNIEQRKNGITYRKNGTDKRETPEYHVNKAFTEDEATF